MTHEPAEQDHADAWPFGGDVGLHHARRQCQRRFCLPGALGQLRADVGDLLAQRIPEVIQGVATTLRGSAEIEYRRGGKPTVNDPAVAVVVREALADVVGAENVLTGPRVMGSEDFAEFTDRLPSTFFFVGCRDESNGIVAQHHHPRFDIDERSLPLGVEMMTRAALHWLETQAAPSS